MKRIALVIGNAYSYAGTEKVCSIMSEIYNHKNEVHILSLNGSGVPFYNFGEGTIITTFSNYNFKINNVVKFIKQKEFDYVFIIGMGKLSLLFSTVSNIRFYNTKTKFYACEHVGIRSFSFLKRVMKIITLAWYEKVIVLTEKDRSYLGKYLKQVLTIGNPIIFNGYHRKNFTKNYIAVGRLSNQKGFDKLIDIWSEFTKLRPDCILSIIGDGEQSDFLQNYAREKVHNKSIVFLGRQSKLDKFYKNSDAILMTSQYEGLPMVLLEAKSWSLPAIAFDCPTGPKEIINDSYDGYLIPLNDNKSFTDRLIKFSSDLEEFDRLQNHCKISSNDFSFELIKDKWLSLIS